MLHITSNYKKREMRLGIENSQHENSQDATGISEWNFLCKFATTLASCRCSVIDKSEAIEASQLTWGLYCRTCCFRKGNTLQQNS